MMAFSSIEDSGAIRSVSFLWQYGVLYDFFSFPQGGKSELAKFFYGMSMNLRKKDTPQLRLIKLFQARSLGGYVSGAGGSGGVIFVECR